MTHSTRTNSTLEEDVMRTVKLYLLYLLVITAVAGIAGLMSRRPSAGYVGRELPAHHYVHGVAPTKNSKPLSCQERLDRLERELVIIEIYCATVEASCRGEPISDWSLPVSSL